MILLELGEGEAGIVAPDQGLSMVVLYHLVTCFTCEFRSSNLNVINESWRAQPARCKDDQCLISGLRTLQVSLPADRHVVGFPAVMVEFRDGRLFESCIVPFAVTDGFADAFQHAVQTGASARSAGVR